MQSLSKILGVKTSTYTLWEDIQPIIPTNQLMVSMCGQAPVCSSGGEWLQSQGRRAQVEELDIFIEAQS